MLVVAATGLLFLHAAFATLITCRTVKFNTRFFAHAIMYLHGHPGGDGHVQHRQYGQKDFFHFASAKVEIFMGKCDLKC